MFQFPTFPSIHYFTHIWINQLFSWLEFPHSDIHGSQNICFSPWLFAAYHVFLRLLVPRHSPYALSSLTFFIFFNPKTLQSFDYKATSFSSLPYFIYIFFNVLLVGSNGIEPSTSCLSGMRSNHLSYEPIF